MALSDLGSKLRESLRQLQSGPTVGAEQINALLSDVARALIEADVNVQLGACSQFCQSQGTVTSAKRGQQRQCTVHRSGPSRGGVLVSNRWRDGFSRHNLCGS